MKHIMTIEKTIFLLFALSVVLCRTTIAGSIPLTNPGFENPVLSSGAYVYDVSNVLSNYGWTADTPDRTWMIYNPTANDAIQPTEGTNWLQLTRSGSTMAISQITTGHQIRTNTLYRVAFDYVQRSTFGSDALFSCTLYAALNGQQHRTTGYTLAESGLVYFDKDNQWKTAALEWNSTGSSLVGQNFDLAISGKAIIDNVRIEIVPEPLLAYEGFIYTNNTLADANGGYGWATSWKGNAALTTNSLADMQTNSVPSPTGYFPTPIGGSTKMANPGGAVAAYRRLASESDIDLGVTSTYYMSILVERSGSAFAFGLKDASGTNNVLGAAVSTGGAITLSVGTNSVTSANIIGSGSAYLWVFKVVASTSGTDTAYVQVYNEGVTLPSSEPTTWLLSNNAAVSSTGSVLYLGGGSNRTIQYDEVCLGATWESVIAPALGPIPEFGIILNDDGDFSYTDLDLNQSRTNLCEMISSLETGLVSTLIYSVSTGDILLYPSTAGSVFGWRTTTSDTNSPWKECIAAAVAGEDAVRIAAEEAKAMGLYFIPSFRMNDAHFVSDPTNNILTSEFWMDHHTDFELGASPVAFADYKYLLDYSHTEVREHRLAVIHEVIDRYSDIMDGLQLDFMRNPILFPTNTATTKDQMTGLIAAVRASLDEAGRREGRFLSLHVRVPPSLACCEWASLDVEQWLTDRLVDVVIPSPSMTVLHDMPVDEFVALAQPVGAKVYPGVLNRNQFVWPFVPDPDASDYAVYVDRMAKPSQVRAAAVNYLNRGAAGFEMYNFNLPPYHMPDFWDFVSGLNDPWEGDRIYMTPPAYWDDYQNLYEYSKEIPATLSVGSTTTVSLVIGDTLCGTNGLALRLGLRGLTASSTNNLAVTLNGTNVYNGPVSGAALPVTGGTSSSGTNLHPQPAQIYVQWPISSAIIHSGIINEIAVTLGPPALNPVAQLVEAQFAGFD